MKEIVQYFQQNFKPLDIIGTTSAGIVAKKIWTKTWGRGKPLVALYPYFRRKNQSTHSAITCLGKDGRRWLMEMDLTKKQKRYVSEDLIEILLPEEYEEIKQTSVKRYDVFYVLSGIKLTDPQKYLTDNLNKPHICWIGRYEGIKQEDLIVGNEWLFDKCRNGVPYDYADIIALWGIIKKVKFWGIPNLYICSELIQRCYETIGLINKSIIPMTPQQWQENKMLKTIIP